MSWLLPTRGRPQNLRRFLNSAREMGTGTPGYVVVNEDDWDEHHADYQRLQLLFPPEWSYLKVDAHSYGEAIRKAWSKVKDDPWIGLVSDDLVCASANWDKHLIGSLQGWNFVSSNDGWQANANIQVGRMHGAIVWSGDLARAIGWIFPEKLKHIFHDNVWETIGRETGCWHVRMDIMCKHLHEILKTGHRGPTMDPQSDLWKHDQAVFEDWLKTDKDICVAKIRELQAKAGVVQMRPDFTGVSVFIGTPTIDGKYESTFQSSLYQTMSFLTSAGVVFQFAEEKYTADIAYGRSKLFAAFVRSKCSHMLMIDADMGWTMDAIMRLFCAKKDFVAIAGPKKRYPLSFAANYTDDNGDPIPLQFDQTTGTMEVGEIGSAFCLITKTLAEKLVQAYPELEYIGVSGEKEWGVFIPMIQNRRYFSEDFGFCKRWRNIGGHCFMVPDIEITHTGYHTFSGAFAQTIVQQRQEAAD